MAPITGSFPYYGMSVACFWYIRNKPIDAKASRWVDEALGFAVCMSPVV